MTQVTIKRELLEEIEHELYLAITAHGMCNASGNQKHATKVHADLRAALQAAPAQPAKVVGTVLTSQRDHAIYAAGARSAQPVNQVLVDALRPIVEAVRINDSDTLSSHRKDETAIWTASGSWTGSKTITLGDLRSIAAIAQAQAQPLSHAKPETASVSEVGAITSESAQPKRPPNCGTGHCSCIECVMEPAQGLTDVEPKKKERKRDVYLTPTQEAMIAAGEMDDPRQPSRAIQKGQQS